MRAGWKCVTTPMAWSWRSARGRGQSRRPYVARSPIATMVAASPADLPFGQAHHIKHWAQGGPTTLTNLVLLCRRHHRAVHEEGFEVERCENGELQFRSPHGWVLPSVPPPPTPPDDAEAKVRAWNTASGITIDPHTATP